MDERRGKRTASARHAAYSKLAYQGMRRNRQAFLPYLLALAGMAACVYIVAALAFDPGLNGAHRAIQTLQGMMSFGLGVVCLFTFIFILYTNSFLFKQRKKELALYQILGMGRRNIAGVLAFETLYTALAGVGGGLFAGIALFKLIQLALCRAVRVDVVFGLSVNLGAALFTAGFFGISLLVLLGINLLGVRRVKPIELLWASHSGEREPRTRWLLALLGVGALGAGYFIALRSRDAMQALAMYFPAVLLVIVGTYCLFTAVSITALKLMRRAKGFYYRPNHFISVSGMLYRMKQNAVGMANICILSTMVMVMVSGTVSLYAGTEQMLAETVPADYVALVYCSSDAESVPDFSAIPAALVDRLAENGVSAEAIGDCVSVSFAAAIEPDGYSIVIDSTKRAAGLRVLTAEGYADMMGEPAPEVGEGEILLYGGNPEAKEIALYAQADGELIAERLPVGGRLERFPNLAMQYTPDTETVGIVVRDDAVLWRLYSLQRAAYGQNSSNLRWECHIDADADDETQITEEYTLYEVALSSLTDAPYYSMRIDSRAEVSAETYAMNGSFLFLGLFLGLVMLIATVLIIYYKQISEGYDDRNRFEIMQKVGLGQREARRTINHQILMVFFMPLAVAGVHMLMDFRMMNQMLTLFSLMNMQLTALCSLGTFAAFSAVYAVVYALTARVYYRIVQGGESL